MTRLLLASHLFLCLSAVWMLANAGAPAPAGGRPGCQTRCGNVDIPFPFGIGKQCAFHSGFQLSCNTTVNNTPKPFYSNIEVTKISVPDGKAWMRTPISWQCYDPTTGGMLYSDAWVRITNTPFWLSDVDNKIIVIGCNTLAYMGSSSWITQLSRQYVIGCSSTCKDVTPENGSCSGAGCCQADVPKGIRYYKGYFNSNYNTTEIWKDSRCSYMAVMETAAFSFSTTYLTSTVFNDTYGDRAPVVMDWVITFDTCEEAKRNTTSYACVSSDSQCVDSSNGRGYRCSCSNGYEGNPYINDGCKDINECLDNATYPCAGICENTSGGFTCSCKRGEHMLDGVCQQGSSSWEKPVVGASVGILILVITVTCAYMIKERRKLHSIKQKYFRRHGGLLLFEEMKSQQGVAFKLFSEEELQQATDKFSEKQVLGHGGHGTVYKGLLKGNVEVAVKRCKTIDEQQKKEFVSAIPEAQVQFQEPGGSSFELAETIRIDDGSGRAEWSDQQAGCTCHRSSDTRQCDSNVGTESSPGRTEHLTSARSAGSIT